MQRIWTRERITALSYLAEFSTKYRPNGVPLSHKDWYEGLKKMGSQNPKAFKLLKGLPISQLKSAWHKYQNVASGYCATTMCGNKIDAEEFYCVKCKPAGSGYNKGIYANPCLGEHKKEVEKVIKEMNPDDLKVYIIGTMEKLPLRIRKELLGDSYKALLKESK